jgi:hypothetical protein
MSIAHHAKNKENIDSEALSIRPPNGDYTALIEAQKKQTLSNAAANAGAAAEDNAAIEAVRESASYAGWHWKQSSTHDHWELCTGKLAPEQGSSLHHGLARLGANAKCISEHGKTVGISLRNIKISGNRTSTNEVAQLVGLEPKELVIGADMERKLFQERIVANLAKGKGQQLTP